MKSIDSPADHLALQQPESADPSGVGTPLDTVTKEAPLNPAVPPPNKSREGRVMDIIRNHYGLVYGEDRGAYLVDNSTHNPQAWRIDGPEFNPAVRRLVYLKNPDLILTNDDLAGMRDHLEAITELTGDRELVFAQVAPIENGIELDQGDDNQTRIRITASSVEVVSAGSQTLFYRYPNSLPFATPAQQGNIDLLLKYLNLAEHERWLLIAWITYTLAHPKVSTTNYVILVLRGDRGSGKSTLCKIVIGSLVGPSIRGVQAFPANQVDLAIAVQNAHVSMFDNLRTLTPAQADALCRCSTSATATTRKFHTNGQEFTHSLHGALVLNGIHPFIDQPDLAQRCLTLTQRRLDPADRTTESQLRADFQRDLPVIFRGVLDLIAAVFKHLPRVTPKYPERMLEFVLWLAALERARGLPEGELQRAYRENLTGAMRDSLQDDPLAEAVIEFAGPYSDKAWSGTPTDLLLKLGLIAGPQTIITSAWPQNEISLSLRLKKLQPQLSGAGVEVKVGVRSKARKISVHFTGRSS